MKTNKRTMKQKLSSTSQVIGIILITTTKYNRIDINSLQNINELLNIIE